MSQSGSQESAELPARFVPEMSKEESLGMTIVGNMMVARIINNITFIIIIIATDQDLCQNFKCVTIFFGNIVGFDSLAADCNPDEVDR